MLKASKSNLNLGPLKATNKVDEAGDEREGVSKKLFSSPSKSKALSSKTGEVETAIFSTLIPLMSKTKTEIKLKELPQLLLETVQDNTLKELMLLLMKLFEAEKS
jgi:hypothetical protein